jgi:hypothetical protein
LLAALTGATSGTAAIAESTDDGTSSTIDLEDAGTPTTPQPPSTETTDPDPPSTETTDPPTETTDPPSTETAPASSLTATQTTAPASSGFTLRVDFTDDSPAKVYVDVSCSSGTVTGSPLTVTEKKPASVTVDGVTDPGETTCTATEDPVPDGYAASGEPQGPVPESCVASLAAGECTIVNSLAGENLVVAAAEETAPSITVSKQKLSPGPQVGFEFTLMGPSFPAGDTQPVASDDSYEWTPLTAGTYELTEEPKPGWQITPNPSGINCNASADVEYVPSDAPTKVIIHLGSSGPKADVECTFKNEPDDQPGTLTVVKELVTDNGGSLECGDFSFTVDGGEPVAFEADCSNDVTVAAGSHTVVEDPLVDGYTTTYANDANENADCSALRCDDHTTRNSSICNEENPVKLREV